MNSPTRLFLALAAGAALSNTLCARDKAAEKPAPGSLPIPETKAPADVPKYALKNRSFFTISPETRAPFWPIGWVKRAGTPKEIREKPNVTFDENAFSVTSILMGSPSLAVINGRAYSEGELIRMPKNSATVRPRVQSINDGTVTLQSEDQTLVVALRRPQLAERRSDDLLDPNR
jgi:hypothetical protein